MAQGYTKLSANIVHSSVWQSNDTTLRTWIALLSLSESTGYVPVSLLGLVALCPGRSITEVREALDTLEAPDPYSRTTDHEGRRIQRVEGGWMILNYLKYRDTGIVQPKSQTAAERQRAYRERQKERAKKLGESE